MDPDDCTDFQTDTCARDDWQRQRTELVNLLTGAWIDKPAATIKRYGNEVIDGTNYNGWAMWAQAP